MGAERLAELVGLGCGSCATSQPTRTTPQGCKELVPAELSPSLPTIVRNHFLKLSVLNAMHPAVKAGPFAHHWRRSLAPLQELSAAQRRLDNGEPEAGVCIEDPVSHKFMVAPVCDGRIVDVAAA